MPVHAASFIKRREIVLETQLLCRPRKLQLILAHEVFHFVWARLGNPRRAQYAALVFTELESGARGELGESSEGWKLEAVAGGDLKNYICESFCDTAAWLYSGVREHADYRLGKTWRGRRSNWFKTVFPARPDNKNRGVFA